MPNAGRPSPRRPEQIVAGRWHEQFVVDPFQAGAGTSHNMNANEVIANLANEALGGTRGDYKPVHPNDHVNMAQSTNDVIPTVIRVAAYHPGTAPARRARWPGRSAEEQGRRVRCGAQSRAHAPAGCGARAPGPRVRRPMPRLSRMIANGLRAPPRRCRRLGIGGTATGTGLNSHPRYHQAMVAKLSDIGGDSVSGARATCSNRCRAQPISSISRRRCAPWPSR